MYPSVRPDFASVLENPGWMCVERMQISNRDGYGRKYGVMRCVSEVVDR